MTCRLRNPVGRLASLASAGFLALSVACGGADALGPRANPGLHVISGAAGEDSAFAVLTAPLVLEVRDSSGGLAKVGTTVRFEPLSHESGFIPDVGVVPIPELFVRGPSDDGFYGPQPLEQHSDSVGRVVVQVRLGYKAGIARLRISCPALGVADTLRYTVVAASPGGATLTPTDTSVTVGSSVAFHGGVLDRNGNPRADPVAWAVSPSTLAISPQGVVSGTRIGEYTVIMTASPLGVPGAIARLTVLPYARVATWIGDALRVTDLDGNNGRRLATVPTSGAAVAPRWTADGGSVIYATLVGGEQHLFVTDTLGATRPFLSTPLPAGSREGAPAPSADGRWVVFTATGPQCGTDTVCVYRARADGSSPELLGKLPPTTAEPSPDGSRVVLANRVSAEVLDVATRALTPLGQPSYYAAWSPDGSQIAVAGPGPIVLVNVDGSIRRTIASSNRLTGPISWTHDGNYVLGSGTFEFTLYDVRDGTELPVVAVSTANAVSIR